MKSRGFPLEVDEEILDWLTAHGYDPHFGARFLKRTIERHVTTALAEVIVRERLERGSKLTLSVRAGTGVASVARRQKIDSQSPSFCRTEKKRRSRRSIANHSSPRPLRS